MIAEAPVAAAGGVTQVLDKIRAFVATAQTVASDGLTLGEFAELTVALLRVTIDAVDSIPIDGPAKKQWVLEGVAMLFDAVADRAVPMAAYPIWILVRPAVRSLVLAVAGGAVESILPLVRLVK
jgi:hypothetical protein